MKKMQCEVCGSSLIKKINDTTFECQSCGVQYDNTEVKKLLMEVTGTVKIDHSDEVENNIKRAQQFEEAGDTEKAAKYYNAALDMDADNKSAQEALKNLSENQKLEEYYIVEPTIDPKENVKNFLQELATAENVACDIFSEINIKSVTEKMYTFLFMKAKCECQWSATACHIYYENQTRYRTVRSNGYTRQEPYTERVKKINREPRSGSHWYNCQGLGYSSNILNDSILGKLDKSQKEQILNSFEKLQASKYNDYKKRKIKANEINKENGIYKYNGYEVDLTVDKDTYLTKRKSMLESYNESCLEAVAQKIGGDYYENLQANRFVREESVANVCIPVQIIEYSYKEKDYIAISDLVSRTTTILASYPCDIELMNTKDTLSTDKEKANQLSGAGCLGLVLLIPSVLGIIIGMFADVSEIVILISSIGLVLGSILMIANTFISKKRIKKFQEEAHKKQEEIYAPRMIELTKSYEAFFNAYNNYTSIESAKAVAVTNVKVENIESRISEAGEFREFKKYTQEEKSAEEIEIAQLENEKTEIKAKRKPSYIVMSCGGFVAILGMLLMFLISLDFGLTLGLIIMMVGYIIFIVGLIMWGINYNKVHKIDERIKEIKTNWVE